MATEDNEAEKRPGREKIESGQPAECEICEAVFAQVTLTWRYCLHCSAAFCVWHGRFFVASKSGNRGYGVCVWCWKH